jgi:hypothetical protein
VTRLPVLAFAALVVATVAAFFITQHLKVSTPLLAGFPRPVPAAINPVAGVNCYDPAVGKRLDYRQMSISFYLLNQSDRVDVWVVNSSGQIVATLARGTFMTGGSRAVRKQFVWKGRENTGALAPDGVYYVRVRLLRQGRSVTISDSSGPVPFRVITKPPKPLITRVSPQVIHTAPRSAVRIDFTGNGSRLATVLIYRRSRNGHPALVKSFIAGGHSTTWDGLIRKRPAPPGSYYVGLEVTDAACNTASFPPSLHSLTGGSGALKVTVLP